MGALRLDNEYIAAGQTQRVLNRQAVIRVDHASPTTTTLGEPPPDTTAALDLTDRVVNTSLNRKKPNHCVRLGSRCFALDHLGVKSVSFAREQRMRAQAVHP